ncbi:hypothetical protein L210DRAFT_3552224 [Boletus edulis BED1]|uniref:Uncharacterized protein n=1 Tax=Boletus edulis BED1 TaxID=1328754 RepID=A0AAD4BFB4_BOLED|nr:hypothetical protein L210DRAFT_3568331 [Boletus edulis BED1]KAF8434750.1 hypothetical protein L210DRAFT_3552224 [Boletus edulis BED1]
MQAKTPTSISTPSTVLPSPLYLPTIKAIKPYLQNDNPPRKGRVSAIARGSQEVRRPVRVYSLRLLLDQLSVLLIEVDEHLGPATLTQPSLDCRWFQWQIQTGRLCTYFA